MNDESQTLDQRSGDGAAAPVSEDLLTTVKNEIKALSGEGVSSLYERRTNSENVRYCKWEGQSEDGKKHREKLNREPFPFEGASDVRIRLADMIVNERVLVLQAAVKRMSLQVTGMEMNDKARANKIGTLMRWIIKNQLGNSFRREIKKLAQYQIGDSPAGAVLFISWNMDTGMETKTTNIDELVKSLAQKYGQNLKEEDILDFVDMIKSPYREDDAVTFLHAQSPQLKKERVRQIVKDLRETGTASYPSPYVKTSVPQVSAKRLFKDIFFPLDTTDYQRARYIFLPEWLSEAELEERKLTHGYSEDFITAVKQHKGLSGFQSEYAEMITGDGSTTTSQDNINKEKYEIITYLRRAVDDDGVMGIYTAAIHCKAEIAAKDEELLSYKHGQYPGVFFSNEVLTDSLLDTRGVPELVMTEQNTLKLLTDSNTDYTSIATIPPVFTPSNRPKAELVIGPMRQIKRKRTSDYEWMKPPPQPRGNDVAQEKLMNRVDEYFGRPNAGPLSVLHMQGLVEDFLSSLADAMMQLFQLCQQYMPDDVLKSVVGGNGIAMFRDRKEIQGKYNIALEFDVRNLDQEFLLSMAKIMSEMILPMDSQATVMRDQLIAMLFHAINPNLAERALQPVDDASIREVEDEELNFTKIAAGIEPQMKEKGQNHGLRLKVLNNLAQKNPEAITTLKDASKMILEKRMEHLQFMVQQQQNAEIGRVGSRPALEE